MGVRWSPGRVESDGESIYYEVSGDEGATTVVLGHGAGGSHAAWFQQVPVLTAAGYRVVTWDTRGFGCSTCATDVLDVPASVRDLTRVLDAAGVDEAVIVGQSMGGWWAGGFAMAVPERTKALVLANTVGGLWTDGLRAHFATLTADAGGDGSEVGAHPALDDTLRERDPALAFLYQQLNTFHTPPMHLVVGSLGRDPIAHDAMRALPMPKLWITASNDPLFPAALVRESAERIGARFEVIDGAGHSPYFERADAWNEVLVDFLGTIAR
jgi:pimeloyl-ACP methyl ester carboxylesterase